MVRKITWIWVFALLAFTYTFTSWFFINVTSNKVTGKKVEKPEAIDKYRKKL